MGSGQNGTVTVLSSGYYHHDICPGMVNLTAGKVEPLPGSGECGNITIMLIAATDHATPGPVWKYTYNLVVQNHNSLDQVTFLMTFSQPMAKDKFIVTPSTVSTLNSIVELITSNFITERIIN